MTFGEKLQELLDWRGKSQSKVAELAEVSQSAISDYVNGRSTPSIDAARRIAKALDVSLWTLLNGEALAVVSMDLTEREREILVLVALGKPRKAIAAELFISEDTVKTHTRNLYKKLGVHSKKDVQALFDDGSPLKG